MPINRNNVLLCTWLLWAVHFLGLIAVTYLSNQHIVSDPGNLYLFHALSASAGTAVIIVIASLYRRKSVFLLMLLLSIVEMVVFARPFYIDISAGLHGRYVSVIDVLLLILSGAFWTLFYFCISKVIIRGDGGSKNFYHSQI